MTDKDKDINKNEDTDAIDYDAYAKYLRKQFGDRFFEVIQTIDNDDNIKEIFNVVVGDNYKLVKDNIRLTGEIKSLYISMMLSEHPIDIIN